MDLAGHQRLVSLTGGRLARAWIATWQRVREANPHDALADRLHHPDPVHAITPALATLAVHRHNAFVAAAHEATRWLGRELEPPVRVRKKDLAFDPIDADVMSWAERNKLDLVRGVGMEQRSLIRAALIEMEQSGRNPKDVARELWDSLGLTPAQDAAVRSYRRALESQQYGDALARELSHGASDRAIAAAARADRRLTAEQIDRAVSRYRENFQRLRAETIMRTEGARVANQAQNASFEQAIKRGDIDADQFEQTWYHSPSALNHSNDREFHVSMHGQVRAWGEPFVSGLGNELRFPCDPDADAREVINCRCARAVRVVPMQTSVSA